MKNMSFRPAGMSDSSDNEYDDDDGFSFHDSVPRKKRQMVTKKYEFETDVKANSYDSEIQLREEKQEFEFRVLNACMTGELSVIDEFIHAGNDANIFLHTGWTMLLYACSSVVPEAVEHLLKSGADPNKHKDGLTPLMVVCNSKIGKLEQYLRCISMLLEAKADPNSVNKDRRTALMYACEHQDEKVVSKLLEHVKDLDTPDSENRTAVFYAVVGNKIENVKLLMGKGASTSLKDRRNLTIEEIAMTKGYDDILDLLSHEGEDIETYCPTTKITRWNEAFPGINEMDPDCIDPEVASILSGLGLEQYRPNFKGMELSRFMALTEDELIQFGMKIQYQRREFLDGILKIHEKKWLNRTIGTVSKSLPYTMYDGVRSLGNIARQIRVIGSSFCFIKDSLSSLGKEEIFLTEDQKKAYSDELKESQKTLVSLKKEIHQMLNFAENVERKDAVDPPATFIGPEQKKRRNWPIMIGVTLMIGLYLSKTGLARRLWD